MAEIYKDRNGTYWVGVECPFCERFHEMKEGSLELAKATADLLDQLPCCLDCVRSSSWPDREYEAGYAYAAGYPD